MAVLARSFPPLVNRHATHLILGSMPGQASLSAQQYYAHPRNSFWPIMTRLFEWPDGLSYAERTQRLMSAGVALWDVLASCERPGSLDSAIKQDSVVCNDIATLLKTAPGIHRVLFNGGAAEQLFMRHALPGLPDPDRLHLVRLPSTSPAHAAMSMEQKYQVWHLALTRNSAEHQ